METGAQKLDIGPSRDSSRTLHTFRRARCRRARRPSAAALVEAGVVLVRDAESKARFDK